MTIALYCACAALAGSLVIIWVDGRKLKMFKAALSLQTTLTIAASEERDRLTAELRAAVKSIKRASDLAEDRRQALQLVRGELWVAARPGEPEVKNVLSATRVITEEEIEGRVMTRRLECTLEGASFEITTDFPRTVAWQGMSWLLQEIREDRDMISAGSNRDGLSHRAGLRRTQIRLEAYVEGGDREHHFRISR